MKLTRREFHSAALSLVAVRSGGAFLSAEALAEVEAPPAQRYKNVTLGVQSYSFRDHANRSIDGMIDAMRQLGLAHVELWQGHTEPQNVGLFHF